jgi:hypothetical protein
VLDVRATARAERVYNFTVDQAHTYFVGDSKWLVHNCPSVDLTGPAGQSFTQPGWIAKDLYSELSALVKSGKLPESVLLKMEEALTKFTSGQGGTGIKRLSDGTFELKILGEGGAIRLYGERAANGQIIFRSWERSH